MKWFIPIMAVIYHFVFGGLLCGGGLALFTVGLALTSTTGIGLFMGLLMLLVGPEIFGYGFKYLVEEFPDLKGLALLIEGGDKEIGKNRV